jgi:translocation and assembly module TamA
MALAGGLWGCGGSDNPLSDTEPELISLKIEGNHALSSRAITGKLATTATSWIPFSTKQYLDLAVLESDRKRIERLYQAHGYFDARVNDVRVTYDDAHTKARVVIDVEEGAPTLVQSVAILGIDALPAVVQSDVQAASTASLKKGEPFNEDSFEAAKAALGSALRQQGYAEESVTGEADIDRRAHQAALRFTVVPGRRFTFGPIVVVGNDAVPANVIQDKVAEVAEPGKLSSDSALTGAQNRVLDLKVFSVTKVTHGPIPDGGAPVLPIEVHVREAPFRTLRAGPGIDIEPLRQEIQGEFEWIHRNFLGGLRKLDWDNVLGYVWTPSVLQAFSGQGGVNQGPAGHSKLTFTQPDFFWHDLDLTTSLEISRDVEVGYTYNTGTASIGIDRKWGRAFDLGISYNFQLVQVQGQINSAYLSETTTPALANNCAGSNCFLRLSYLQEKLMWDRRDNPIEPHQGYQLLLDLEEGGGPGASFQFYKIRPEARGYIPIGSDLTLALRAAWGAIDSFQGPNQPTPITQRFYGGGPDDVRAYGSRLMSPVLVACVPGPLNSINCNQNQAIPVGGNGSLLGSGELRIKIGHSFSVVPFVDVGEVTVDPYAYDAVDLAVAPGLGFRYITLFGPIRLDLAYRLPNVAPGTNQLRLAPSEVVVNYPPSGLYYPSTNPTVNRFDVQFSIGEAF